MKNHILVVAVVVNLAACSEPTPTPTPTPTATAEAAAPTEITEDNQGVLTDTQRQGLNAANQMSDQLKEADEARRRQLEALEN